MVKEWTSNIEHRKAKCAKKRTQEIYICICIWICICISCQFLHLRSMHDVLHKHYILCLYGARAFGGSIYHTDQTFYVFGLPYVTHLVQCKPYFTVWMHLKYVWQKLSIATTVLNLSIQLCRRIECHRTESWYCISRLFFWMYAQHLKNYIKKYFIITVWNRENIRVLPCPLVDGDFNS